MKKIALLISFIILIKPVVPLVDYIINYEYISTKLCENRAKPEMHCDGKCHLKKELAKAASDEKPISNKKSSVFKQEMENLFFKVAHPFCFQNIEAVLSNKIIDRYQNLYFYKSINAFFHPPTFINF